MQKAIQVAKDFSPYGFPLTLVMLLLTWYGDRNPPSQVAIDELRSRVIALELTQANIATKLTEINYNFESLQKEFRVSIKQVQRTSCVQLTAAQRRVVEACDD